MALDSKDSDIEQLHNLLSSANVSSLESASLSSGPDFDADDAYTGKEDPFLCIQTQCTSSSVHSLVPLMYVYIDIWLFLVTCSVLSWSATYLSFCLWHLIVFDLCCPVASTQYNGLLITLMIYTFIWLIYCPSWRETSLELKLKPFNLRVLSSSPSIMCAECCDHLMHLLFTNFFALK